MIDRLSGRLALLVAFALVLLIVLVGWFALVAPQRAKVSSLGGQVDNARLQLANTEVFLRSQSGRKAKAELRVLQEAMPANVRMSQILRQLSAAAAVSGVAISGITPGGLTPSTGGQAVPIALTISGHYFNIVKFLQQLRTRATVTHGKVHVSGRLYDIDSLQFSSTPSATAPGAISVSIALNAFTSAAAPVVAVAPATTATG